MNETKYEPIIGLEIHVELKTKSKMFCGCPADWFGREPNTDCCPVCLGLPGALPVPNRMAVEWTVMLGLALGCEIPLFSKFDRKNYFYPDLPKGYQISQYDQPFAVNGSLEINNPITQSSNDPINRTMKQLNNETMKNPIRIRRVHLEEDTGKLLHETVDGKKCTLIDFNRSGVPLVEIVTEPDIRNSEEARTFLKKLHQIIRYLGISDADMEKGSMRLEPNISVREIRNPKSEIRKEKKTAVRHLGSGRMDSPEVEDPLPTYKVEVKNINSFAFVKRAIDYEIYRHKKILDRGEIPTQETRGWDEKTRTTVSQRSKEEAQDYRYFPEPDIPPVRWTGYQISNIKNQIPELPDEKLQRFISEYGLSEYDAALLVSEKETAEYFEKAVNLARPRLAKLESAIKHVANWIINKKVDIAKVTPEELVKLIQQKSQVVKVDEVEIQALVEKVIKENQKAVNDYNSGKTSVIMFLVGQIMRELKGKGDPQTVRKILESKLQ